MSEKFLTKRRVEFCETDAAGIVHFAAFLCYMEQAEHEMLRSLGVSVMETQADGSHISWPRVRVDCEYLGPARFEDILDIEISVSRMGNSSVTYKFEFIHEKTVIAKGTVIAVCCLLSPGTPMKSVTIPKKILEGLRRFATTDANGNAGS